MRRSPEAIERNREFMRRKRRDAGYRAAEKKKTAARMLRLHRSRRARGLCRDCDKSSLKGRAYCRRHAIMNGAHL